MSDTPTQQAEIEAIYNQSRMMARLRTGSPIEYVVEEVDKLIQAAATQRAIEATRVIGYRLDNRMDFSQNKIAWETIEEYGKQLQSQLDRSK